MHKKVFQIIENAANLLTEESWVKGRMAIDENGFNVSTFSEKACKWCAEGAILKCAYQLDTDDEGGRHLRGGAMGIKALDHVERHLEKTGSKLSLWAFNDRVAQSHIEIKNLFLDSIKEENV